MIKRIKYHVYPFDLVVGINEEYESFSKYLTDRLPNVICPEVKQFEGTYEARTLMFSGGQTAILFNDTTPKTIAHEIFHAVEFLFRRIGIGLVYDSGESYAYLIGYITDEIYKMKNEMIENNLFNKTEDISAECEEAMRVKMK